MVILKHESNKGIFIRREVLIDGNLDLFDKVIYSQIEKYLEWSKTKGQSSCMMHDWDFVGNDKEYKKCKDKIANSVKKLKTLNYIDFKNQRKIGGDSRCYRKYSYPSQSNSGFIYIFRIIHEDTTIAFKMGKSIKPVKRMEGQFRGIPLYCDVHAIYEVDNYSKAEGELKARYKHKNIKNKVKTKGTEFYDFNAADLSDIDIFLIRKYNGNRWFDDNYEGTEYDDYEYVEVFEGIEAGDVKLLYGASLDTGNDVKLLGNGVELRMPNKSDDSIKYLTA